MPPSPAPAPAQTPSLDQGVVNLAKSIALTESGNGKMVPNYNAVGDNGTSKGAYQWQPGNYESAAKQYGYDPSDFSPATQNRVAYAQIKSMKDSGMTAPQIAAAWNAGNAKAMDGSWQTNIGTTTINGKKIDYNTPAYVQKVNDYYKQFAMPASPAEVAGAPKPAPDATGNNSGNSLASQFFNTQTGPLSTSIGIAKNIAKPLLNTGGAIESVADQTLGRGVNLLLGKGDIPTDTGAKTIANADKIQDNGLNQKIGGLAGDVLPYITPLGEEKAAATGLQKLVQGVTKTGIDAAIGTAQTKDPKQGIEIAAGGKALEGISKVAGAGAKTIYKSAIPTSSKEASLLQSYKAKNTLLDRIVSAVKGTSKAPITSAETSFNQGLKGTESMLGVQAKRASNKIWNTLVKPQLKASTVKVDMQKFFDDAESKIKKDNTEISRQNQLLEGLNSFREDYANKKTASLDELQKFKEGWAKFIPEKAYKGKPIAGAANDVKDTLADIARTRIYEELGPDVKQAYFDYGNLQAIQDLGKTAMQGTKLRGGSGNFLSGIKDMAVIPVATIGGRVVYRTAQGVEFVGSGGAKTVNDLLNEVNQPTNAANQ
jgi:hypothetical protein